MTGNPNPTAGDNPGRSTPDRDLANPNFTAANRDRSEAIEDAGLLRMDTAGGGENLSAMIPRKATSTRGDGPKRQRKQTRQPRFVRDVMTSDIEVCNPGTLLYYVARMMEDRDCGAIPVVESTDSMRPTGIITDRDIVVRGLAKNQDIMNLRAADVMSSTKLLTVDPDMLLDQCVQAMEKQQLRRAIVVDHSGRTCGIVAQADIARAASEPEASELLREISRPNPQSSGEHYH
jgi:CBS domain-containing protein